MKTQITDTPAYTYLEAWSEAARLQRLGYITRVWFDGRDWRVGGITLEEWEANQNDRSEG